MALTVCLWHRTAIRPASTVTKRRKIYFKKTVFENAIQNTIKSILTYIVDKSKMEASCENFETGWSVNEKIKFTSSRK
jgi:hypothetical protein